MTQWLPIESAPRDGVNVLIWAPDIYGGFHVAWWGPLGGYYENPDPFWCWLIDPDGKNDPRHYRGNPTHWQPLPPPPNNSEG